MIYNNFKDIKLSALGMGAMRFPVIDGDDKQIDIEKTKEMVEYAFKNGVNYVDTAWVYHGGNSESVLGEILKDYPRESFYLATKFPGFDKNNFTKIEEIFEKQLAKCQTDYFDFYLLHNVSEGNVDLYLDEQLGLLDYLLKQKELGRIKYLGFSAHGSLPTLRKFLSKTANIMEFCQLQINYIDYTFQNAKEKIDLMNCYNIPVWVMEPLRGGKLATLKEEYIEKLNDFRNETPVAWAFRFLQTFPEIKMILSGMSNFDQLKENIEIFSEYKPLNIEEMNAVLEVASQMSRGIPCTGCKYCTEYCPMGLDIPRLLRLANEKAFMGSMPWGINAIDADKRFEACIGCKSCEVVCPQNIKISEVMEKMTQK